jgi:hypothetical protein
MVRNAGVATAAATITVNAILDSFILFLLLISSFLFRFGEASPPQTLHCGAFMDEPAPERKNYFHYFQRPLHLCFSSLPYD